MTERTPRSEGFYVPAEWEEHEGTWLQWPHDKHIESHQIYLESIWLEMTRALHQHERVHIVVTDEPGREHLEGQLAYYGFDRGNIDLHVFPTDDVWVRDSGPIFMVNDKGELAAGDWNFNGWGERYPFAEDTKVPAGVAGMVPVSVFTAPITLEGGGIEVNGNGTLMATLSSIVNPNRNPGKSQAECEMAMREYLGVDHFIWLSGKVGVGDTDVHIDGAARFVDESTVLYSWTDDRDYPRYDIWAEHKAQLEQAVTESGKPLTLVPVPVTKSTTWATSRLPTKPPFENQSSLGLYANYYVANNVVLVPVYGDVNDAKAKNVIGEHFPGREIVGILAHKLAEIGGMIHCVTQQQPRSAHSIGREGADE